MYFKKAGRKTQVLAYRGYNREKKRADVRMIGSIDGYTFSPTERYEDSITEAEREEIKAYIDAVRQKERESLQKWSSESLPDRIGEVADAIKTGKHQVSERWARDVWTHLDELGRVLRKSGYGKHKTTRGTANDKANSQTEKE